eukprot:1756900-Amphidinium_carterae.2
MPQERRSLGTSGKSLSGYTDTRADEKRGEDICSNKRHLMFLFVSSVLQAACSPEERSTPRGLPLRHICSPSDSPSLCACCPYHRPTQCSCRVCTQS